MHRSTSKSGLPVPGPTWEAYSFGIAILGAPFFTKLHKISDRQVLRWAADPAFADQTAANPIDRMRALLRALVEKGRPEVAASIADMICAAIGGRCAFDAPPEPDKATILGEVTDDAGPQAEHYAAIEDANEALADGRKADAVAAFKRARYWGIVLVDEIQQNIELLRRKVGA